MIPVRAFLLPALCSLAAWQGAEARKIVLFSGKDLAGWHSVGTGRWSVVDGAILGRNPDRTWNHLVTDSAFGDHYLRLKFRNVRGNTGVYFRSQAGGDFGMTGMQIELAPGLDGSVMWVTNKEFGWVAQTSKSADSGIARKGEWNELAVETRGRDFTVFLNGRMITAGKDVARMAAVGRVGLQLHGGDDNEVHFKDIEVFLPTRIPGCTDARYREYRPEANDPLPGACMTLVPLAIRDPATMRSPAAASLGEISGAPSAFPFRFLPDPALPRDGLGRLIPIRME